MWEALQEWELGRNRKANARERWGNREVGEDFERTVNEITRKRRRNRKIRIEQRKTMPLIRKEQRALKKSLRPQAWLRSFKESKNLKGKIVWWTITISWRTNLQVSGVDDFGGQNTGKIRPGHEKFARYYSAPELELLSKSQDRHSPQKLEWLIVWVLIGLSRQNRGNKCKDRWAIHQVLRIAWKENDAPILESVLSNGILILHYAYFPKSQRFLRKNCNCLFIPQISEYTRKIQEIILEKKELSTIVDNNVRSCEKKTLERKQIFEEMEMNLNKRRRCAEGVEKFNSIEASLHLNKDCSACKNWILHWGQLDSLYEQLYCMADKLKVGPWTNLIHLILLNNWR